MSEDRMIWAKDDCTWVYIQNKWEKLEYVRNTKFWETDFLKRIFINTWKFYQIFILSFYRHGIIF